MTLPGETREPERTKTGLLVIDVVDTKKNKLVWQGSRQMLNSRNNLKTRMRLSANAVNKIMAAFSQGK